MHSQSSEEEIIQRFIKRYPDIPKTCVEFGATDGLWLSNTAKLWKEQGWKATLIECDDGNFKNLQNNTKGYDCTCVHKQIEPTGPNRIDNFVRGEIGVMSIDVDGNDYHIFKEMVVRPWIVLVEVNATFPPEADIVGALGSKLGCSARALARLAAEKGYVLSEMSGSNLILERADLLPNKETPPKGIIEDWNINGLGRVFQKHSLSYLVQDYEGNWAIYREPVFGYRGPMQNPPEGLWTPQK